MKRVVSVATVLFVCTILTLAQTWKIHDMDRPQPAVVDSGAAATQQQASRPPSDAIVLFGGADLSQWQMVNGDPVKWKVENGYFETAPSTGPIASKQGFGDCQLHVEFAGPTPPRGSSQGRGNSGVFLMGKYEVQVLDSYQNQTYPDGQAGSIYGQYPPLVNASRPPGEWQTYDIIFRAPRFDAAGKLVRRARLTLLHNGVVVQDNMELTGPTNHQKRPPYQAHPDKLPLTLQDHGNPVKFRSVWVRELKEVEALPL